jgi:Fe-S-cluster containining protein
MTPTADQPLAFQWLAAARDPAIAAALESIYNQVSQAINTRGPSCWASGRCCNFEKTGHRLYVTGLEAAYTVSRLTHITLDASAIQDARARGGCPLQVLNLCGAHTIKPLGCRVYFCDRSAQTWQQELSEQALDQIKALHNQHAIEYRYGEWRSMLELFTS